MITIEELFAEDFKPAWAVKKDRFIQESFEFALTIEIEMKWRDEAKQSVKRISAKHPPKHRLTYR